MQCKSAEVLRHFVCAEFVKMFRPHISSTMNDPSFPSDFIPKDKKEEGEAPTTVPDKLTLNFFLPHETTMKDSKVRKQRQSRFHKCLTWIKSRTMSMGVLDHMSWSCLRNATQLAQP